MDKIIILISSFFLAEVELCSNSHNNGATGKLKVCLWLGMFTGACLSLSDVGMLL